jgi:hypothetical protein
MVEVSDVLLAAVLLFLTGFINAAGQDLWTWLRSRVRRE